MPKVDGDATMFQRIKQGGAFEDLPAPLVAMSEKAVTTAREVWQQAGVEAKDMMKDSALEWVTERVRHGKSLKSALDKGKEFYGDYSKPIYDLYHRDIDAIRAVAAAQVTGDDATPAADRAAQGGHEVGRMTAELSKKSVEWGVNGGLFDGHDVPEPKEEKPGFVAIVKKVLHIDRNDYYGGAAASLDRSGAAAVRSLPGGAHPAEATASCGSSSRQKSVSSS